MWLMPTDGSSTESTFPGDKSPFGMVTDIKTAIQDAYNPKRFQGFFISLENEAIKTNKIIFNGIESNQRKVGQALYDLYTQNLKYNIKMSDITDYLTSYADQLNKIPNIQEETIKNAIIFSKVTGFSTKEVAGFVGQMANVGISQENALAKLNKMYATARTYGVNAKEMTSVVMKNIDKASTYGFKNGIDGLTKMVARAQQMGLTMEGIMKTAEKAFDPDEAIKMASEIQMLGGAVGALGDPFQLLYMAQNDIGKLQEEIINATKSTVMFNEETGEFKLPVSEMYRMREMASKLGLDYNELSKAAINAAKQQEILARNPGLQQYSEEDRNLISSLAEIGPGGNVEIRIPGTDKMMDVANLSQANIDALRADSNLKEKTTEELQQEMVKIADSQLSGIDKSAAALEQIKNSLVLAQGFDGYDKYPNMMKDLATAGEQAQKEITNSVVNTSNTLDLLDAAMQTQIDNFSTYTDSLAGLATDLVEINKTMVDSFKTTGGLFDFASAGGDFAKGIITALTGSTKQKDYFDLQSGKKTYSAGFGEMIELDPNDQALFAPNIDELFEFSNRAYQKLGSIQKNVGEFDYGSLTEMLNTKQAGVEKIDYSRITEMLTNKINPVTTQPEQITNLQDILSRSVPKMNEIESININQTNTTTQKVEGNVGVDGNVNINVNVPNGLLSNALSGDREFQQTLKEEIMNVVNDRLSKAYSQRQGNFSS
jgi:hypothetical protein